MGTPVLQLTASNLAALNQQYYPERLQFDADQLYNQTALDGFSGLMTGSCYSIFSLLTSSAGNAGLPAALNPNFIGAEYTRTDRILQEVVAWASTSGSGGVTRIDVQVQNGSFATIFSNNAFKPAVSSSLGNYGLAKSSTFVSGSNTVWKAGTLIKVIQDTSAGDSTIANSQNNLTVMVFWKPSGSVVSYGV